MTRAGAVTDLGGKPHVPKGKPRVTFKMQAPGLPCAHKGQTGYVAKIEQDGGLYIVLACGHVMTVSPDAVGECIEVTGLDDFVRRSRPSQEEGMKMAKANKIANVNGVIPVQGYSNQVKDFRYYHEAEKRTKGVMAELKKLFRKVANDMYKQAEGDVVSIEFLADDGAASVLTSIPDIQKPTNRTKLSSSVYKEALKLGFDVDELGVTSTETTVTLSGDWAQWFINMINAEYREAGKDVPNGDQIAENEKTCLTPEGIAKLRAMADTGATEQERKLAQLLLDSGIKDGPVSLK